MSNSTRRINKSKKEAQDDTIDIDTFKAWLSGVEDMQGDDWTPSPEQWKKIRAKINQLSVPEYEDPKQTWTPQHPVYRQPSPVQGPIALPVQPYQQPNGTALPPTQVIRPTLGQGGSLPAFQAPGAGTGNTQGLFSPPADAAAEPGEYTSSFS